MASLPIRWIVARAYCQATEVEDRVARALDAVVPAGDESRERLEGQFGNPVVVIVRRLARADDVRDAWSRWTAAGLPRALAADLESRLDPDGVVHFRLDKEAAFEGTLALAAGAEPIDIQVKLKAYPANPQEIQRVARSLVTEAA